MSEVLVDADGCPVKQEIYRVAKRYGLKVTLVAQLPSKNETVPDSFKVSTGSSGPFAMGSSYTIRHFSSIIYKLHLLTEGPPSVYLLYSMVELRYQ